MAIRRVVSTEFWTDAKVVDNFTPEDRYFMLYLLTNPHTTLLGIYPISKRFIAFEMGYTAETVEALLNRFQDTYDIIRYSTKTGEIAIKNYLRHSIISGGKPVADCLRKDIANVKDKSLVDFVFKSIADDANLNETVKLVISLYFKENNCASYDTSHESSSESCNESVYDTTHDMTPYGYGYGNGIYYDDNNARARAREGEPNVFSNEDCDLPGIDTVQAYASNELDALGVRAMEELNSFVEDTSDEVVRHAIDNALDHGARSWKYVKSILNHYAEAGVRTVEQAVEIDGEFEKKRRPPVRQPTSMPQPQKLTAQQESEQFWANVPFY